MAKMAYQWKEAIKQLGDTMRESHRVYHKHRERKSHRRNLILTEHVEPPLVFKGWLRDGRVFSAARQIFSVLIDTRNKRQNANGVVAILSVLWQTKDKHTRVMTIKPLGCWQNGCGELHRKGWKTLFLDSERKVKIFSLDTLCIELLENYLGNEKLNFNIYIDFLHQSSDFQ